MTTQTTPSRSRRRGRRWDYGVFKLYVTYDDLDRVLYVGTTIRTVEERLAEHEDSFWNPERYKTVSAWWPYAIKDKTEVYVLNDGNPMYRYQAERVEKRWVKADGGTIANSQWNGGRGTALRAREASGHPDPTYRRQVQGAGPTLMLMGVGLAIAMLAASAISITAFVLLLLAAL